MSNEKIDLKGFMSEILKERAATSKDKPSQGAQHAGNSGDESNKWRSQVGAVDIKRDEPFNMLCPDDPLGKKVLPDKVHSRF